MQRVHRKTVQSKIILETIQTVMGNHLRDVTSGDAKVNESDESRARIAAGVCDTVCTAEDVGGVASAMYSANADAADDACGMSNDRTSS